MFKRDIATAKRKFEDSSLTPKWKNAMDTMVLHLKINTRLKTCAGRCKFDRGTKEATIEINPKIFARQTVEERYNTVSHELAHAVEFYVTNNSNHGSQWKTLHRAMGGSAERCHNICMAGLAGRNYKVVDNDSQKVYYLTRKQVSKILRSERKNCFDIERLASA